MLSVKYFQPLDRLTRNGCNSWPLVSLLWHSCSQTPVWAGFWVSAWSAFWKERLDYVPYFHSFVTLSHTIQTWPPHLSLLNSLYLKWDLSAVAF